MPGGDLHRVQPTVRDFYEGKPRPSAPKPSFDERDVGSPKQGGLPAGYWPGSAAITKAVHDFKNPHDR